MSIGSGGAAALTLALLLGCSTVSVNQDYDPDADFARLKSFAWYPAPRARTGDHRLDNPLIDRRIRSAVERELAERGHRLVTNGRPDFFVAYHLSLEQRLDVRTINHMYSPHWVGRRGSVRFAGSQTHVTEFQQGTLILDISDALAEQLVWRGWGSRRLRNDPSPERSTEIVDAAVSEILAQFPPR